MSPNTIIAWEKWIVRSLDSLFKEVTVFKVVEAGFKERNASSKV